MTLPRFEGEAARPAVFLDRDGVINMDDGYTFRAADLRFTPTAVAAIRRINEAGWWVIVVTNQSGVARGLYGTADVEAFHRHMAEELRAEGAQIDAFYYAPSHPDGTVPAFAHEHEDRKPGPGMLLKAMRDHPIDRSRSVMIGDKDSDMEAAARAGVAGVLVAPNAACDLLATVEDWLVRSDAVEGMPA